MLRPLRFALALAPLLALVFSVLMPDPGATLPLFARKYSAPCTLCHIAFPRLNAFGMAFRQNGYRQIGEKGHSPWEDKEFPLSLVGNVGAQMSSVRAADSTGTRQRFTTTSFEQNAVEFHTAGTLAEKVSFHFDNGFSGVEGNLESGMAFVQFDDISRDGALNIKAGIYDAEIPYISDARTTTLNGYLSPMTLDGRGIELNGTKTSWTYALGLINSERIVGKPDSKSLNSLEDVYGWLMRDVGGQLVTGRLVLDRQDPRKPDQTSSGHVLGQLSAYLNRPRWVLIPAYTYEGFADEPETSGTGTGTLAVQGGLLEGTFLLDEAARWVLTSRYEIRHVGKSKVSDRKGDDEQFVLDLAYYVNPNARVALDWTHTSLKMHNVFEDNLDEPMFDQLQAYIHLGY
jgi:hypothetical protein